MNFFAVEFLSFELTEELTSLKYLVSSTGRRLCSRSGVSLRGHGTTLNTFGAALWYAR